jgi:peptidoglycan-associated lipoprotein
MEAQRLQEQEAIRVKEEARMQFVNEDVYFNFDDATLTSDARMILKQKVAWLRENPGASVLIEGHCDERGTAEYNIALGQRRAQSIKTFMINAGISASRLSTVSYGEERPVDFANNESAWAKNRRAHFKLQN